VSASLTGFRKWFDTKLPSDQSNRPCVWFRYRYGDMAMTAAQIEIPDQKAVADDRPIWKIIVGRMKDWPPEDLAAVSRDGASQVDHYIYGLPKREQPQGFRP
jgi:hypothetical protein